MRQAVDCHFDRQHLRILRRLVQKTQKRLNGIEGIKQQPVFLLYLCKDRLILPQIFRPARAIDRIQQPCGKLLWQFADQAEHIAQRILSGVASTKT